MKKGWVNLSLVVSIMILFISFSSINVNAGAGNAGVGVLSPPPQFSVIRLVQQDSFVRVYITVSDINSWKDLHSVSIVLEDSGVEKAKFNYKQYENVDTWDTINEFSEESAENNLLVTKSCSYDHEDEEETLTGCYTNLIFVFQTTWFSRLNIIAEDRGGASSTLQLDYTAGDLMRSGDIIIFPGMEESITIELPPYLLDIIAILIASLGTWYFIKKTDVGKILREVYEKN